MNPTTSHSCDAVRAFIDRYGAGDDVQAAQRYLTTAEPKLAELRDDEAWSSAADDCKRDGRIRRYGLLAPRRTQRGWDEDNRFVGNRMVTFTVAAELSTDKRASPGNQKVTKHR
ncbi:hypothetical protein LVJ94_30390 [Pendulispora rubella]|uniref:Uncharacterized protein n=1 Tax=Pendulispora rubella TaxID=2741070 RepID=A0ABZ2KRQ9_9BACT